MDELCVVLTTAPDGEVAKGLARTLVAERLAACVNVVPGLTSVYVWRGEGEEEAEVLLVAKVRRSAFDRYAARLTELHPYDVPEIVALPAAAVSEAYRGWWLDQTDP
ncbi:MAG: divalent-cation tolerance protein CutA [Planctomycetota bacterium JB042]